MSLQELFEANRPLFYTLYGQVFFLLGVAIALRARRDSDIALARPLWLLSAFGFAHGLYEWSYVILPIQKGYLDSANLRALDVLQRPLEALSFYFLFQFGAEVVNLTRRAAWLRVIPGLLLFIWIGAYWTTLPSPADDFRRFSSLADLWARYLLCFPGALLAGGGLLLQAREACKLGFTRIRPHLCGAAWSFFLYAVIAGVLVPPAPFLPASLINRQLLSSGLGFPPPIARALAGILIAYFVIRSLKMFEVEMRRRLEESQRDLAIAQERERISRELHDGTIQTIYGSGLQLESAFSALPDNMPQTKESLRSAIDLLNRAMGEIRESILELSTDGTLDYAPKITELIERVGRRMGQPISFKESGTKPSHPFSGQQLFYLLQEALSNVVKHSRASRVEVGLDYRDDRVTLSVIDNGVGFKVESKPSTMTKHKRGLNNMRKRAEILGGEMSIHSSEKEGSRLIFTIPYVKRS